MTCGMNPVVHVAGMETHLKDDQLDMIPEK